MATENPYKSPEAVVSEPPPLATAFAVPEEVLKKIKHAWIAALFSGAITSLVVLISLMGTQILGFSAWELIDVAMILALAFGIYKKSRTCAVLMLVYFVASKILIMVETGKPSGAVMGLLFAYFFWQGVSGTFAYHRLLKKQVSTQVRG